MDLKDVQQMKEAIQDGVVVDTVRAISQDPNEWLFKVIIVGILMMVGAIIGVLSMDQWPER